jgi:hypothetical protein
MARAQHAVSEWKRTDHMGPLNLSHMDLTALPPLPADLTQLVCTDNFLSALPPLPSGLRILNAARNRLTELPDLPITLTKLDVTENKLAALPPLPATLEQLYCSHNCLTDQSLVLWPPRLHTLHCSHNRLRLFPEIPGHITRRHISVCWTFRPHLLRISGGVCPCCGQPAGTFGPPI